MLGDIFTNFTMTIFRSVAIGIIILGGIIGLAIYGRNHQETEPSPTVSVSTLKNNMHEITLTTTFGDIVFETYDADAPKTVENFVNLASKGFYDNLTFHRVIKGFMIQGGDPKGDGTGGPGYVFADELNPRTESYQKGYVAGTVAMANAGPNTNGSQFFIMHKDMSLDPLYSIFGHVVRGQDVVDKIASVKTNPDTDRPLTPVVIKSVVVKELQ
jgi:cyclophilin family peptidyl-prolyl cis-trans isomerase